MNSSTTKSGKSASHPTLGMTWKRALKIERIARLSLDPAGYTNEQIGNFCQCDKQTVVLIRQLPEYHAKMMELLSGITSPWDSDLRADTDASRAEMKSMVPSAMMVIRNALLSKNENIRVKAAMEVFDREGTHAKVSKSSVSVTIPPNLAIDPTVGANIMQLLSAAPTQPTSAQEIGAATGSAGPGFTTSAKDAEDTQVKLDELTTEESLAILNIPDSKTSKPN